MSTTEAPRPDAAPKPQRAAYWRAVLQMGGALIDVTLSDADEQRLAAWTQSGQPFRCATRRWSGGTEVLDLWPYGPGFRYSVRAAQPIALTGDVAQPATLRPALAGEPVAAQMPPTDARYAAFALPAVLEAIPVHPVPTLARVLTDGAMALHDLVRQLRAGVDQQAGKGAINGHGHTPPATPGGDT